MKESIDQSTAKRDEFDFKYIIYTLRKHKVYFLIGIMLAMAASFVYNRYTHPIYEAKTSIIIESGKGKLNLGAESLFEGLDMFQSQKNIATEIGILKSRSIIGATINELNLNVSYFSIGRVKTVPLYKTAPFTVIINSISDQIKDASFELNILDSETFELDLELDNKKISSYKYNGTHKFGDIILSEYWSITINKIDIIYDDLKSRGKEYDKFRFIVNDHEKLIDQITEKINIKKLDKDASIIEISITDELTHRATDILNKLIEVYIENGRREKALIATNAIEFIDEQLEEISNSLINIELDLKEFKERKGIVNLSAESQLSFEKLNKIDIQRSELEVELNSLTYLYDYVINKRDSLNIAPSLIGVTDPMLIQLLQDLQTLQNKRSSLIFGSTTKNPTIRVIDNQLDKIKRKLVENILNIKKTAQLRLTSLAEQIRKFEDMIRTIPNTERELIEIQRKYSISENIYIYLLEKKAESGIARASTIADSRILDLAYANPIPIKPTRKISILILILLSIILPSVIIFIIDFFSNSVASLNELTQMTNIGVLGIIGHKKEIENFVVNKHPKSHISEAFRSIRTNLLYWSSTKEQKIILITSSISQEGKTFCSINLAYALALSNKKVVLLGFDLRKPALAKEFSFSNDTGITSYLVGKADLPSIIHKTENDYLDVIPSGPIPPNPSELILNNPYKEMLEELRSLYDYIVIDTPPIGVVSDAMILMKECDTNLFIVREGFTKRDLIKNINNLYRDKKLQHVNLILNDSKFSSSYYGYEYSYYDDETEKPFFKRLKTKLSI